eukprot:7723434-Lingulodinium_polyedra.AAC.1
MLVWCQLSGAWRSLGAARVLLGAARALLLECLNVHICSANTALQRCTFGAGACTMRSPQ